jgi:hypothetical protein
MRRFEIGDEVKIIGQTWPVPMLVIGFHGDCPIIQPQAIQVDPDNIRLYAAKGAPSYEDVARYTDLLTEM